MPFAQVGYLYQIFASPFVKTPDIGLVSPKIWVAIVGELHPHQCACGTM